MIENISNHNDIYSIYPTSKFTKLFIEDVDIAAEEIWSIWYPRVKVKIEGKSYSSKGIDYDDFVLKYRSITKNVFKRHLEILNITKNYVKGNPQCLMSLRKYVGTRYFDDIADEYTEERSDNDFITTI